MYKFYKSKFASRKAWFAWSDETIGLWLGVLGVIAFGITLPMTRLAVGPSHEPQLDPVFVTAGRAAIAGILSIIYLRVRKAKLPSPHHWKPLFISGLGTAVFWPLFIALALRNVHAMHAAVITGILPLSGAIAGALYFRQRPSLGFWGFALFGCFLVISFAVSKGGGHVTLADVYLLGAVIATAIGFACGADVSRERPAPEVICWVLVIMLPISLPVSLFNLPKNPIIWQSWAAMAYLSLFSMWLGFFVWYRGLALGGMVRVSQVQLLQPFVSLIAAIPLLGERIDWQTIMFMTAIVITVFFGRKMPVGKPSYRKH